MRIMSGKNMALYAKYFCQNTRAELLRDASSLCCNADRNFDRNQCEQFYENVNESINSYEKIISEQLKRKCSRLLCNIGKD